jgi:hypothetical protein
MVTVCVWFFFFFPVLCNLTTIQLKRDESIRIRKEAEEAKFQKMKAIQREKVSGWWGGRLMLTEGQLSGSPPDTVQSTTHSTLAVI